MKDPDVWFQPPGGVILGVAYRVSRDNIVIELKLEVAAINLDLRVTQNNTMKMNSTENLYPYRK